MIKNKYDQSYMPTLIIGIIFYLGMVPLVFADVFINVMAVNGADVAKETNVKFDLPSDVTAQDILETDGLELAYDVEDANFFVQGKVELGAKQSKTFKIRLKDVWKIDPAQVESIKSEIDEGYNKLGMAFDENKAAPLKEYLLKKIDTIVSSQTSQADSIEKRIDSYRTYRKELMRVKSSALAADYWRSDLNDITQPKIIRLNIEADNPTDVAKPVKFKHFLPVEVKAENVLEPEGFDVRFDQQRQQSFLFKEETIPAKEKRKYSVGVEDVWTVPQNKIDYFASRTKYAYDFLSDTRFADGAKILNDRIVGYLDVVKASQAESKPIEQHISAYRENLVTMTNAETDLETLEKLLAVYREDLEKSKVKNILQRVQSLNSVANVSKAVFNKKFENSTAWSFIGWILVFVGLLTGVTLIVWLFRSKEKTIIKEESLDKKQEPVEDKQKKT